MASHETLQAAQYQTLSRNTDIFISNLSKVGPAEQCRLPVLSNFNIIPILRTHRK